MRRAGGLWSGQPTASRTRAKYGERIVDAGAVRCGGCMCAERETEDAGGPRLGHAAFDCPERLADALRRCAAGVWEKRFLVFPGFLGRPLSVLGLAGPLVRGLSGLSFSLAVASPGCKTTQKAQGAHSARHGGLGV